MKSKHLDSCTVRMCTGCGPDSDREKFKVELETWKDTSRAEYKRGQKYKKERNALQEELRLEKEQKDRWQNEYCKMGKIRDSFVQQRDELQKKLKAAQGELADTTDAYNRLKDKSQ